VSYSEIRREICLQWYPRDEFLRFVDSKKREWLVYDASGTAGFLYHYPLGSPRAFVRVFWREDHVRETPLAEDADRGSDTATIKRQLRYSRRVDFPEHAARSTGQAIQNLYDSRHGIGATMTESRYEGHFGYVDSSSRG
jgi:hypothetical protein